MEERDGGAVGRMGRTARKRPTACLTHPLPPPTLGVLLVYVGRITHSRVQGKQKKWAHPWLTLFFPFVFFSHIFVFGKLNGTRCIYMIA